MSLQTLKTVAGVLRRRQSIGPRIFLVLSSCLAAFAQQQPLASQPDCLVANNLPVPNGNGIVPLIGNQYFDNRGFMCTLWAISYRADSAVTGFTVSLQSAEGSQTPGTFGAFAGTKLVGTTSFGTASSGAALYTSLPSSGTAGDVPWIRV